MQNNERKAKNSKARIKANDRYNKANYKNISIRVKPDQAEEIRATAENLHQSLAQLIINAVRAYADIQTAGADPAQPEQDPTESPMESGETTGAQPEEETENEIEAEEETTEEENQTAGAETTAGEEEPQEDEETTEEEAEDIPEELKAVRAAWARMGAFNEKITAERKRREAEERERRREITDEERYMMR